MLFQEWQSFTSCSPQTEQGRDNNTDCEGALQIVKYIHMSVARGCFYFKNIITIFFFIYYSDRTDQC